MGGCYATAVVALAATVAAISAIRETVEILAQEFNKPTVHEARRGPRVNAAHGDWTRKGPHINVPQEDGPEIEVGYDVDPKSGEWSFGGARPADDKRPGLKDAIREAKDFLGTTKGLQDAIDKGNSVLDGLRDGRMNARDPSIERRIRATVEKPKKNLLRRKKQMK